MTFGLFGASSGICAQPSVARRLAVAAEKLGFDSLWTGEHVVVPDRSATSRRSSRWHPSTRIFPCCTRR